MASSIYLPYKILYITNFSRSKIQEFIQPCNIQRVIIKHPISTIKQCRIR